MGLDERAQKTWQQIIALFEDKLQYGFLKQAESVVDIKLAGSELVLFVTDSEALDYFRSPVNQLRLMILSRPVVSLESVVVHRVQAEPLKD